MNGYFGIGIENIKTEYNIGTLFRSAYTFGADFIFTINKRYKQQSSDTFKTSRHIPLFNYETFEDFYKNMPYSCMLVGIEIDPKAEVLKDFIHPERCIYLLGAEDHGLTKKATEKCHKLIQIPSIKCLNVSVAGSIIMYDRMIKAS